MPIDVKPRKRNREPLLFSTQGETLEGDYRKLLVGSLEVVGYGHLRVLYELLIEQA